MKVNPQELLKQAKEAKQKQSGKNFDKVVGKQKNNDAYRRVSWNR